MTITADPLVSIVLITYNSAKYVLETLESVKKQTWRNIELIISDDGSNDLTIKICTDWLKENKHHFQQVHLITVAENTGIPKNCNRGLRATRGEWLKTISGDDILLPNCIADNMAFSRLIPDCSFIFSDVNEINENGSVIREHIVNESLLFFGNLSTAKKQLKAYSRWPAFLNTPSFFSKREVIEKVGFCDENFKIYEDMTMIIRMMERNIKMYYMPITTVSYRIHQQAISRSQHVNERREKEAFMVFKKYREPHLSLLNPFDLSVYYENWLRFKFKGINGRKGIHCLRKLSLYYWHMKFNGIKTY